MDSSEKVKRYLPIGELLAGKAFSSFNRLRSKANKLVRPHRDNWFMAVLIKNSVFINPNIMTKRELVEILEKYQVSIIDDKDVYRIYKGDDLIGEWDNRRMIRITKDGKLEVRIQYWIV
jgi:hypothetical protein